MALEKLVFFDIECAKRTRDYSAICSFGYVITDLKFNVLESRDILINPEAGFNKKLFREYSDCRLGYSKNEFKRQPNFPKQYEIIKKILLTPKALVVGFAVAHDIDYLLNTCKRYDLASIRFETFDIRSFLKTYMGISASLEGSLSQMGVDVSDLTWHKSCDDAMATMRLFKACFEKTQKKANSAAGMHDCIESVKTACFERRLRVYRKHVLVKMLDYYGKICERPKSNKLEGSFRFIISAEYDIDRCFALTKLFYENGAKLCLENGSDVIVVYPDGETFINPDDGAPQRKNVHLNELLKDRGLDSFSLEKQGRNIPDIDTKKFIEPKASSLRGIKAELAARR